MLHSALFFDIAIAKSLGCTISLIPIHPVVVAGGGSLAMELCLSFFLLVYPRDSIHIARLIASSWGCDLVRGVQWLHSIGSVTMNFPLLQMHFISNGKTMVLKGMDSQPKVKLITASAISMYASQNPHYVMGFLYSMSPEQPESIPLPSSVVLQESKISLRYLMSYLQRDLMIIIFISYPTVIYKYKSKN